MSGSQQWYRDGGLPVSSESAAVGGDGSPPSIENITQQNERYKMVIQSLFKENEELKRSKEASEWLIKQNKDGSDELKKSQEDVKRLNIQLYHWQNSANDAHDRLKQLSLKKDNKQNSADIFYDSSVKRVIETLANENHILLQKHADDIPQPHRAELLKTIDAHEKTIQNLRQANEYKYKENQRLQQSIKRYEEQDGNGKLLAEIKKCQEKISFILQENTKLKAYLIQKHNVMEYLKSIFENTKDDIIKIFIKCYKEDEQNFLDQLKGPENEVPEFMTRPLVQNSEVQTVDQPFSQNIETQTEAETETLQTTSSKFDQERFDSGIESLTREERIMFQELKTLQNENQKILAETKKMSKINNSIKTVNEHLKTEDEKNKKLINELHNELASWKTALTQSQEEGTHFRQECETAKDETKTLEVQLLNLKQQVPFHIDTRRILKEKNELQESLKTMEAINHNLHSIIEGKRAKVPKQPAFKKSFSADTQTGQSNAARYATESSTQEAAEYIRKMRLQQPVEPWQQPWHQSNIGGMRGTVAADGAIMVRDSDPQQSEQKKNISQSPHHSPSPNSRRSPTDQTSSRKTQERPTAAQMMEGISRSMDEELFPCENCGRRYPSSKIWEHIRTCTQQYDD